MSRIGKNPIPIPQGVKVNLKGNEIEVEGPRGRLQRDRGGRSQGQAQLQVSSGHEDKCFPE